MLPALRDRVTKSDYLGQAQLFLESYFQVLQSPQKQTWAVMMPALHTWISVYLPQSVGSLDRPQAQQAPLILFPSGRQYWVPSQLLFDSDTVAFHYPPVRQNNLYLSFPKGMINVDLGKPGYS